MDLATVPQATLAKLLQLDGEVEAIEQRASDLDARLSRARKILAGNVEVGGPEGTRKLVQETHAGFDQLLAEQRETQERLRVARAIVARAKSWLAGMPADTRLEPATVNTAHRSLSEVREKIAAAQQELTSIRSAPVPSGDIRDRIAARVNELGRALPAVTGVAQNELLKVTWPNARLTLGGPDARSIDPLVALCRIAPDAMIEWAMADIARQRDLPLPVAERPKRIAELEAELDRLGYEEEALCDSASRSPHAHARHVLQVRIATAKAARAA